MVDHRTMYILFLITSASMNQNEHVLCHDMLYDLFYCTRTIIGICRTNEAAVSNCFTRLFENANKEEMKNSIADMMCDYECMLAHGCESAVTQDYSGIMCTVHLRAWADVIVLFMKNDYIVAQSALEGKVFSLIDYLRKNGLLDQCPGNGMHIKCHVPVNMSVDELIQCTSWLIHFLVNNSKYLYDFFRNANLNMTDDRYRNICSTMDKYAKKCKLDDNELQNNKSIMLTASSQTDTVSDDAGYYENAPHLGMRDVNDNHIQLNANNLKKENKKYGKKKVHFSDHVQIEGDTQSVQYRCVDCSQDNDNYSDEQTMGSVQQIRAGTGTDNEPAGCGGRRCTAAKKKRIKAVECFKHCKGNSDSTGILGCVRLIWLFSLSIVILLVLLCVYSLIVVYKTSQINK